jgi:hypothetical protein
VTKGRAVSKGERQPCARGTWTGAQQVPRLPGALLMAKMQAKVECRAYGAQISLRRISQPFRAGLFLDGRPSGPRSHGDLRCHFSLNLPQASRLLPRHAGARGMTKRRGLWVRGERGYRTETSHHSQ